MKKILILIGFLYSLNSFSQSTVLLRGDTIKVYKQGGEAILKVEGQLILNNYKQGNSNDSVLTWDAVSKKVRMMDRASFGSGGGGLSWSDTSTIYDNLKWSRILNNESNSTTYSPVLYKDLTVDMNNKQLTFDLANGIFFNSNTNDWSINGGGFGVDHQSVISNSVSKRIEFSSGYSSTRRSTLDILPDSIAFLPGGGGRINVDSLRDATVGAYVWTWDVGGMVGKMPTVKYNITSPQDGDILIYDEDNDQWINSPSLGNDSSFYIKEYPDVSYLDTSPYNAALIDGRLWIKYGDDWRRQAYDSTYTPATPPDVYFTDDFTGTNGDATAGRTTTTGSLTWSASAGTTIGQSILSNANHAAAKSAQLSLYTVNAGHHDIDLRGTIGSIQASAPLMFLMLAAADDNNFIQVDMVTCAIHQNVASSYTTLYGGSGTSSPGDIIRCNLNGTTLDVYRNGSLVHSQSVSGALTSTKHGIFFYDDGSAGGSSVTFIEGREAE